VNNEELAKKLMDLFSGFESGHGTYNAQYKDAKGKLVGHAEFIQEPVTISSWLSHLKGELGLGLGPINNSSKCKWGAIDIDDYTVDHLKLVKKIKKLNFPLITVKSKSGGAHLFLFMTAWVSAELIKNKLGEMVAVLGHAYTKKGRPTEIFPRQSKILSERGDMGNWLNLPYFGTNDSNRYALDDNINKLTIEQFLQLANKSKITEQQLKSLNIIEVKEVKNEFKDAPVCLSLIVSEGGIDEGNRNTFMYNMGVLSQKIHPHNRDLRNFLLEEWNQEYCHPALSAKELCVIQSTLDKHPEYKYQCKESLLKSYCNVGVCKSKKYGLSGACQMPALSDLTKLTSSPSVYFLQINDIRVEFPSTDDLINQTKFQTYCVEQASIMPPTLKRSEWTDLINQLLQEMRIVEASADASIDAQLEELLESFAEQMIAGFDKQDIARGLPWFDPASKKTLFKLAALESYLSNNKFIKLTRGQLISKLKTWGGESKQIKINGRNHNIWQIALSNVANKHYEVILKTERDIL